MEWRGTRKNCKWGCVVEASLIEGVLIFPVTFFFSFAKLLQVVFSSGTLVDFERFSTSKGETRQVETWIFPKVVNFEIFD